jgi:hypothetical protein
MKKLDDIPKKEIFSVPEGYFDELPGIIQARVAKRQASPRFSMARFSLRYALPGVVVVAAALFWYLRVTPAIDPENVLAGVDTEQLIAYIEETDLSTEELMEQVELDQTDIESIVDEVYGAPLDPQAAEELIDELEF